MLQLKAQSASKLAERLNNSEPIDNADIILYLDEKFISTIARQYEATSGWLDESTNYIVKKAQIKLYNGSANATLSLMANNITHNITVDLNLDCIFSIQDANGSLFARLEPYNIYPTVTASGLLASSEEIIENLVKINLAELGKNFKDIIIPLDFNNTLTLPGKAFKVKDKINLIATNSERTINYSLKIKEILIFDGKILIAINLNNIELN